MGNELNGSCHPKLPTLQPCHHVRYLLMRQGGKPCILHPYLIYYTRCLPFFHLRACSFFICVPALFSSRPSSLINSRFKMLPKTVIASAALALAPFAFALPQVSVSDYPIPATAVPPPGPAPPVKSSTVDITSHGPYTGPPPTTTGALSTVVLAPTIPALPPNPTATTYPSDGQLHAPEPAPYTPAGGLGTNGTLPVYNVKSDFDYESIVSLSSHRSQLPPTDHYHRLLVCTKNGSSSIFSTMVSPDSALRNSRPPA